MLLLFVALVIVVTVTVVVVCRGVGGDVGDKEAPAQQTNKMYPRKSYRRRR